MNSPGAEKNRGRCGFLPSDGPSIRATAANATTAPSFISPMSDGQRGDQTASLGVHLQPDFHCKFSCSYSAETGAGWPPRSDQSAEVEPDPVKVSSQQSGRLLSPGCCGCRRGFLEVLKDAAVLPTEDAALPGCLYPQPATEPTCLSDFLRKQRLLASEQTRTLVCLIQACLSDLHQILSRFNHEQICR